MKLPQGIRTKLLAIMFVVSGMTLVTAAFGVLMMRRLADTSDAVLARYLPISRCAEQALLAVTQCAECMHEARLIDDPADADRLRIVEGKLRHSIIRFEMHTKAMMWGSESEVFARSWGGLMKTLWQREGWDRVMVVQRAPHQAQQAAGEADIYFAGFDKYAREALRSQKRMLRLQLKGQNDEARAEQLLQQGHLRRAERFASLVNLTLERSIKGLHQQIETVQDEVEVTQRFAARAMIAFAAIAFLLSLVSGSLFASAAITRPIRRLHRGTDIVGAGNLDHKVGTAARDEIGQLARAFDRMTDNLKAARSDLERQVARRQAAEETTARQKNVLAGINEVFRRALTCKTDAEVAQTCLAVAERLTGSQFGLIGEVNRTGRIDAVALSNPGWDACRMPESDAVALLRDMEIRGIWGAVLKNNESLLVNDPAVLSRPRRHPRRPPAPDLFSRCPPRTRRPNDRRDRLGQQTFRVHRRRPRRPGGPVRGLHRSGNAKTCRDARSKSRTSNSKSGCSSGRRSWPRPCTIWSGPRRWRKTPAGPRAPSWPT